MREDLSGSEYLQQVLGDVLAKALTAVARERPKDPIGYMAEFLYSARKDQVDKVSDQDSGHYEDQEAPSNASTVTLSTLELSEQRSSSKASKAARSSQAHRHAFGEDMPPSSSEASVPRSRHTSRSRHRRRTAQSEPTQAVTLPSSNTYVAKDELEQKRSHSLNARQTIYGFDRNDPRRLHSRRVPAAALPMDDYRKKRGLRLSPMRSAPRSEPDLTYDDRRRDLSLEGKVKPKQLQPLKGQVSQVLMLVPRVPLQPLLTVGHL